MSERTINKSSHQVNSGPESWALSLTKNGIKQICEGLSCDKVSEQHIKVKQ